ncbi:MAG: hypothetical protein KDN05_01235, partial [Verrucomicrobiae bacterium]|nr:hypothetical protein [Verrucomicrobiae bacterium]
ELPVSLNDQPASWVPIKTRLSDFLERNAAHLLDPAPELGSAAPFFSFSRRLPSPGSAGIFMEFRFWGPPSSDRLDIELYPGDSISFKP